MTESEAEGRCLFGQGERCCAFLAYGSSGWLCLKTTNNEALIWQRLILGTMTAKGDNCDGPPNYTPHPGLAFDGEGEGK